MTAQYLGTLPGVRASLTVTVFERDELPDTPTYRSAVPQDRHLHLLMARGALEFEALFPSLLAELLDSLYTVPSAPIIGRAVAHNMRLWLRERRSPRQ
ncbi:hypothetical protein MGAST_21400 [Mycobacterium gastri 'Wayne']|uniref:Uncharacterized protein n=1 Tax=Mycobacterium gastri TaxID=1777 RepID=A0A1X1UXU9_MYCGS|nr:hypothetical protein MGAST_21400 [Mycobacterium gastri 'Wayne']ORV61635.1 hypothetical protein AWC07_17350 [Mycobacterium gastri]